MLPVGAAVNPLTAMAPLRGLQKCSGVVCVRVCVCADVHECNRSAIELSLILFMSYALQACVERVCICFE